MNAKTYLRFGAMIATSTLVMFGLMYLNTYQLDHARFSETRAWMALVMGAVMAVIMLLFMLRMYTDKRLNLAIIGGAVLVFAGSLWLVRSQETVNDVDYMRAMIPHHSIAIMTSSRADISDPRVRKLADEIIYAQDKEIAEMRFLIDDIDRNGDGTGTAAPSASAMTLDEALATADLPSLDPQFMTDDEIALGLSGGTTCRFTYTEGSRPVLALASDGAALMKISGDLVQLQADPASLARGPTAAAAGVSMAVNGPTGDLLAGDGERDAVLTMSLDRGMTVGYSGFYDCRT